MMNLFSLGNLYLSETVSRLHFPVFINVPIDVSAHAR